MSLKLDFISKLLLLKNTAIYLSIYPLTNTYIYKIYIKYLFVIFLFQIGDRSQTFIFSDSPENKITLPNCIHGQKIAARLE